MIIIDGNISQKSFGAAATIDIEQKLQPIKFTQVKMGGRKKEKLMTTFPVNDELPLTIDSYSLGFISTNAWLNYSSGQYLIY